MSEGLVEGVIEDVEGRTRPELEHAVSVVIPAFNEAGHVADEIHAVQKVMQNEGWQFEIIVVDDGSEDGTAEEAANAGVRVLKHKRNKGYGAALKQGIQAARFKWILITDADGTYPAEAIPSLLARAAGNDMVVGARTGKRVKIPMVRRPAKWIIGKLADYLSKKRIPDLNSGLRAMRKDTVVEFLNILPDGFSFTTTITLAMHKNKCRVHYVPIDYHTRTGKSKIRPVRDTLNFIQLIIRTIMYFDPLRIFLPLSLILFLASFCTLAYRVIAGSGLLVISVILFVSAIQVLTTGMIADILDKRNDRDRSIK